MLKPLILLLSFVLKGWILALPFSGSRSLTAEAGLMQQPAKNVPQTKFSVKFPNTAFICCCSCFWLGQRLGPGAAEDKNMEGMCEEKRADEKTFKERLKVDSLPCHRGSRLTPDPHPVEVLFCILTTNEKPRLYSLTPLKKRLPPPPPTPPAAHCTLISKSNKPGRLNCMSQPGVCGEVIVLMGCRWAPSLPHEADHRRDVTGRWPHDSRRGGAGRCLHVKKEREGEEGREKGRRHGKKNTEAGFRTAGVVSPCPRVSLHLSHSSSWI